jgi:23S rRNA (cytosine1962-C5)-methyltransferase
MKDVFLKPGREWAVQQRHHWIFSGAVASYEAGYVDGELARIYSHQGEHLGYGFFNRHASLAGRVVSFGDEEVYSALEHTLEEALQLRKPLLSNQQTTACRLVNGEGDGLPGLIIDKYGPYLVVQTGALGMRMLLPWVTSQLQNRLEIAGIYDKSTGGSLKEEGIEPRETILFGHIPDRIEILEKGVRYFVEIKKGQKTGFFLDQRAMRAWVRELAHGKTVLNGFSYTGGFSLAALKGGAKRVDSVDISEQALQLCKENVQLNDFSEKSCGFYQADMFAYLDTCRSDYDFIILDPPGFAKKKKDIPAALKGYQHIFCRALEKLPKGSYLLLSSCSYYISQSLFENSLLQAAHSQRRPLRVIGRHRLAVDHPENPFHPESSYLKSLVFWV